MKLINKILILTVALAASVGAQTRYFGGIDVGSKGTKASLFSVTPKGGENVTHLIFGKTINTRLMSSMQDGRFAAVGIKEATDAAQQLIDDMRAEVKRRNAETITKSAAERTSKSRPTGQQITNVRYFIVGSSGVAAGENKDELAASIKAATQIDVDFIDSKREGFFSLTSVVAPGRRGTSIFIDIGSGNTKLGCLVGDSDLKNFRDGLIKYGSVSGRTEAAKRNPTDIPAGIAQLMAEEVGPSYAKQSMDTPCLSNRQRIYWTGGAAWATATLMHPEKSLDPFVYMNRRDVELFLSRLSDRSWNQRKLSIPFPKDTSIDVQGNVRKQAQEDHDSVMSTFSREDLLSGVSVMKTVLDSSNPSVVIVFAREGSFIYGFGIEKFQSELNAVQPNPLSSKEVASRR